MAGRSTPMGEIIERALVSIVDNASTRELNVPLICLTSEVH